MLHRTLEMLLPAGAEVRGILFGREGVARAAAMQVEMAEMGEGGGSLVVQTVAG